MLTLYPDDDLSPKSPYPHKPFLTLFPLTKPRQSHSTGRIPHGDLS